MYMGHDACCTLLKQIDSIILNGLNNLPKLKCRPCVSEGIAFPPICPVGPAVCLMHIVHADITVDMPASLLLLPHVTFFRFLGV